MATGDYINTDRPEKKLDNVYELVKEIEEDMDDLGLEEIHVALDFDLDEYNESVDVDYTIETLGFIEELDSIESATFEDSYTIVFSEFSPNEKVVRETVYNTFTDSAIKFNGEVIRECLSRDYTHFESSNSE